MKETIVFIDFLDTHIGFTAGTNYLKIYYHIMLLFSAFIFMMLRTMSFYSVSRRLGPKVLIIKRMFADMIQFLFLMVIFLAAYGVATQAIIYPNDWRFKETIIGILYVPYFGIYGELFIQERSLWPFEDQLEAEEQTCSEALTINEYLNQSKLELSIV